MAKITKYVPYPLEVTGVNYPGEALGLMDHLTQQYPIPHLKWGQLRFIHKEWFGGLYSGMYSRGLCQNHVVGYDISIASKDKATKNLLFTLAHEYAHVLQRHDPNYQWANREDIEADADAFANMIAEKVSPKLILEDKLK